MMDVYQPHSSIAVSPISKALETNPRAESRGPLNKAMLMTTTELNSLEELNDPAAVLYRLKPPQTVILHAIDT